MKTIQLILISLTALVFARSPGFSTANADDDASSEAAVDDSTLGRLCKGSDVDIEDVRWRIQSGLEPAQAVEAAMAQKVEDARASKAAKEAAKKGKTKPDPEAK